MSIVSVFLGFVALVFSQSIFMFFFVPMVVYILWDTNEKIREMQRRLTQLEAKSPNENEQKNPTSN